MKEEHYTRAQAALPFIAHLRQDEQEAFRAQATYMRYEKDELLTASARECRQVLFLLRGSIRVYKVSEEGREVTLYRLSTGETCLISVACLLGLRSLDASAEIQAGSEVLRLPDRTFQSLLSGNAYVQKYMMERALSRMNQMMRVVELVTFAPLRKRIALFLREAQLKQNTPRLRLTKEAIALEVGTAREVVSRILGEFEQEKLVKLGRGTVLLLDTDFFTKADAL